jgi:hypothetical protein
MRLVRQRQPSSSAYQCPGHDRRVKGAFGVACDRFETLDPAAAPQGFRRLTRKMEGLGAFFFIGGLGAEPSDTAV